jgi:branched-chain amino acid transport system substrate-binding protein
MSSAPSKNITVILEIGSGSFEQGFPVTLEIKEDRDTILRQRNAGSIPPHPDLPRLYETWRRDYEKLGQTRTIQMINGQVTHVTGVEELKACQRASREFEQQLRLWFGLDAFQLIRGRILEQPAIRTDSSVPVIFVADTGVLTQDILLRKIPWHFWNLFNADHIEAVLGAQFSRATEPLTAPVKVLAIFGSREGDLKLQDDETALANLRNADVRLVQQPSRTQLRDLLWQQSWDVLFFAGHSDSAEGYQDGFVQIQDHQSISIEDLREDLQQAVRNGLKLAVFNSCNGLGIAERLSDLKVPSIIVMREPVPDLAAREFLRLFLEAFSTGSPLFLAVKQARRKLQFLESDDRTPCPAATWLPVVCQNPTQPELHWPTVVPVSKTRPFWRSRRFGLIGLGIAGLAIAFLMPLFFSSVFVPPGGQTSVTHSMSLGATELISPSLNDLKTKGTEAFAAGDFPTAIQKFRESLSRSSKDRNDPETWIYLNNAIVAQQASQPLKIAVSVPGNDIDTSNELLRGVAIAQSQVNCGINNFAAQINDLNTPVACPNAKLQVLIANDQDNPAKAVSLAKAFVSQNILAVVGHNSSGVSKTALDEVYTPQKLVLVSATSTSVELSNFSPYFFRTPSSDAIAAQSLVTYTRSQNIRKVAIAYVPKSSYSESLKKEFSEPPLPIQPINTIAPRQCHLPSERGNFDASACIKAITEEGADALLLIPSNSDNLIKALQLVQINNGKLKLLGGDVMYSPRVTVEFGSESLAGKLRVAVPWHRSNSTFEQSANQLLGKLDVNWRTAMSYDATQAILKALEKSPSPEGLRAQLADETFKADGVLGQDSVSFKGSGDRSNSGIGVLVKVANEGNRYTFENNK